MKKRELIVTCSYGSEGKCIGDIVLESFLLFLQRELEMDSPILAPSPSSHV